MGVTIAIRYALARPQFGGTMLMEYVTHQHRLLPGLATTYAMHLAMLKVKETQRSAGPDSGKQVHVLSSGVKVRLHLTRVCPRTGLPCNAEVNH